MADDDPGIPVDPCPRIERLLDVVASASSGIVFWIGGADLTDALLYRHLRTLNKVLIPRGWGTATYADGLDESRQRSGSVKGAADGEAVLFRHAAGNVLAAVLPVLDERQHPRFFGPARGVTFLAPDHPDASGRILCFATMPDGAAAQAALPGMLRLSAAQLTVVEEARAERLQNRTTDYVHRIAPETVAALGSDETRRQVSLHLAEGRQLGVRSEGALKRWCMMQVTSGGAIGRDPMVRDYMTTPRIAAPPDERVRHVLERMLALRRTMGAAP